MKLTSVLTLNEGDYSKLAEWEAAAKKLGFTVTKDNKTGTYHAWDETSHKGRFSAPTGKGHLTEAATPRKGTVAWEREQQRKKQERDPEEVKRIENVGDTNHQVGTAKVTHESVNDKGIEWFKANKPANCSKCNGTDFYRTSHAHTQKIVCSRCGTVAATKEINEAYTGHFNDDDWYEVDANNKVIRHAGGPSAYRASMPGQSVKLPNGNTAVKGMKAKRLGESIDPQDKLSKWTVTYDTYGSNKDVPLKKGATKTVYADSVDAACAEVKKLVGGRNHKAECIRKPVAEADMGVDPISHKTYSKAGVPTSNSVAPDEKRRKANHAHFMALAARAKRPEAKAEYMQKAKAALG